VGGASNAFDHWWEAHEAGLAGYDPQNIMLCVFAFVDDIILVAKSAHEAQAIVNDLVLELKEAGLQLKASKTRWMGDNHCQTEGIGCTLKVDDATIDEAFEMKSLAFL
jgi:hypothetical protein